MPDIGCCHLNSLPAPRIVVDWLRVKGLVETSQSHPCFYRFLLKLTLRPCFWRLQARVVDRRTRVLQPKTQSGRCQVGCAWRQAAEKVVPVSIGTLPDVTSSLVEGGGGRVVAAVTHL